MVTPLLTEPSGAVFTHQRTCWPAACVVKSSNAVVRAAAQTTTHSAVSQAMSPARACKTPTTHRSLLNTIVTTPTTASVHRPTDLTGPSPRPQFAMCRPCLTPRPSTLSARVPLASPQVQREPPPVSAQSLLTVVPMT
jgi:hypothetical protein